jgi:REP-associated tyrosine transposase
MAPSRPAGPRAGPPAPTERSESRTGRPTRRKLNPRVASVDKWKRIEALSRLTAFLGAYREAWKERRDGSRDVLFPAGTYLLRIDHGVRCAAFA